MRQLMRQPSGWRQALVLVVASLVFLAWATLAYEIMPDGELWRQVLSAFIFYLLGMAVSVAAR